MVDTAKFKKAGPYKICFSNAALNNPWRQVGFKTMQAEVEAQKSRIKEFVHVDAEGKDQKQIADINDLLGKGCDALIVSPNTTATLTPAVEAACAKGLPVIVFDRGVDTKCPVTFINPIGGYGFGHVGAEFVSQKMKPGGKVLALRILPGVDVLETRWSAAKVAVRQGEGQRRRRRVHRRRPGQDQEDRQRLHPAVRHDRRRLDGRRCGRRRGGRGVPGRGQARTADQRRGPARLPEAVEGQEAHRDRARPTRPTSGAPRSSRR